MILKEVLGASLIIFLFKKLTGFYFYIEDTITRTYHLSYSYSAVNYFVDFIEKEDPRILENSKIGCWVINLYKKLQKETAGYLAVSLTGNCTTKIKKEFNLYPFKASGILLISAVIINLVLFYIFQHKISALELGIRAVLFAVGFLCLFCDTNWAPIKKGSGLLKILSR